MRWQTRLKKNFPCLISPSATPPTFSPMTRLAPARAMHLLASGVERLHDSRGGRLAPMPALGFKSANTAERRFWEIPTCGRGRWRKHFYYQRWRSGGCLRFDICAGVTDPARTLFPVRAIGNFDSTGRQNASASDLHSTIDYIDHAGHAPWQLCATIFHDHRQRTPRKHARGTICVHVWRMRNFRVRL